jgi:hypothetical protein
MKIFWGSDRLLVMMFNLQLTYGSFVNLKLIALKLSCTYSEICKQTMILDFEQELYSIKDIAGNNYTICSKIT